MSRAFATVLAALTLVAAGASTGAPARAGDAPAPPASKAPPAPRVPSPTVPPPTTLPSPAVTLETRANVEATVRNLAGPERNGRGTWDDRKAAATWIAARFTEIGLGPPPGRQSLTYDVGGAAEAPEARHVIAWLAGRGATATAPGEYLLVGSHYDGVGDSKGQLCPGADDNASGVAALLETARLLTARAKRSPLARSILFVAFDKKDPDNDGPSLFAKTPPLPLASCAAAVCVEMLGRSLLDLLPGRLFVMGAEFSAGLDGAVVRLGPPAGGALARPEIDLHIEASSYDPFRARSIPFLLVTAGFTIDRFLARDDADAIDYDALAARTAWLEALVAAVAAVPRRPDWREKAPPRIEEIRLVRELTGLMEEQLAARGASDLMRGMAALFAKRCDDLLAKGAVTREERDGIQRTALALARQMLATSR